MKKATAALATLLILTTAGCTSSAQNGKTQAPLWAQGTGPAKATERSRRRRPGRTKSR